MSYSFSVTADTKDAAKQQIAQEFLNVLQSQPVHKADVCYAETAAIAFVDVLADPSADQAVKVTVSGWVGWIAEGKFTSANVAVSASLVDRSNALGAPTA